jgi:uncharacterized surface protein with fasciclin (FAS1) repeats
LPENSAVTLLAAAERAGGFSSFLAAMAQAGLGSVLTGKRRYTIFAPTDEAFAAFPESTREKLMSPDQIELLKAVIAVHLVSGQVRTERLRGRRIRGKSVEGSELVINGAEAISVNGAFIVRPDIAAANGVLHGIDKVLWPKFAQRESEPARGG